MKSAINRGIAVLLTLAMALALVLCVPSGVAVANAAEESEELITNGGFENGLTGWAKGQSPDTITVVDKSATDKILKVDSVLGAYTNFSQKGIPATAGETYVISYDYKLNLTQRSSETIVARLQFRDSAGTKIGSDHDFKADKVLVQDWKKLSAEITAPEGTATIDLIMWIWSDNAGECWIDNLSLLHVLETDEPDEPQNTDERITNGGFENDFSNWAEGQNPDTISIVNKSTTDKALKVDSVDGKYTNFSQKGMPVTQGETYVLSYDYKLNLTKLGSETIVARIQFRDSSGTKIGADQDYKADKILVQDWKTLSTEIVAPAGAVTVDLTLWIWSDNAGECWIDNVSLLHVIRCNHDFLTYTEVTPTSCAQPGSETAYCDVCEKNVVRDIPKLPHILDGEGVVKVPATCDETGVMIFGCIVCRGEGEEDYPATGHDLAAVPAKPATATADGNIAYWVCQTCGKYFADAGENDEIYDRTSVIIPKTDGTSDPQGPAKTGDSTALILVFSVMVVACVVVIITKSKFIAR